MTESVLVTTLIAVALLLMLGLFGGAMNCQYAGVASELAGERGEPQACISAKQQNLVADAVAALPTDIGDDSTVFEKVALGFFSGLKNQFGGFAQIFTDPVGFVGDLFTLGKALATDPGAVFDALVEELGADVETLLSGDPFRTAELIGENLSPLQLARVAKRLADFAGSGKIGKRGTRCASFVAGTPIWTGNGLQPIDSLSAGDPVRARSDDTYDDSVRPVVQTIDRKTKRHLLVTIGNERIGVTAEHPFWVQGRGWTPAVELGVGTPLATATGEVLVWSVETVESPAEVFNLTVAWDHSYFAGGSGVWVHNANGDCNISSISRASLPSDAQKALQEIEGGTPRPNVRNPKPFENDGRDNTYTLPTQDAAGNPITYTEHTVNPRPPGGKLDRKRIITGSDGSTYYTDSHFTKPFEKVE